MNKYLATSHKCCGKKFTFPKGAFKSKNVKQTICCELFGIFWMDRQGEGARERERERER